MLDVFTFTDIEMPFVQREKAHCELTTTTEQHVFVREFSKQSPTAMHSWTWHKEIHRGRLFVQVKRILTTKISEETVKYVRKKVLQSSMKWLQKTSLETKIPQTTVRYILINDLIMKPHKLQLVQALTVEDKRRSKQN